MRILPAIFVILLIAQPYASGQDAEGEETINVKKGWRFTPFPAVSYSSDLGFQIGAYLETSYFGDGSIYPEYFHKIVAEAAYFTKGSGIYHLFYDSKYFIKGMRFSGGITYLPSTMADFYGFNGYASPYLTKVKDEYGAFYNMQRNMLRVMANLQGTLSGELQWAAGVSFYSYKMGAVKQKKYRDQPSLYKLYVEEGIIRSDEKKGGNHLELRLGIVYDTRDNEPDPTSGIYSYALLYGSPDIIDRRGYSYLKAGIAFNHYVPLAGKKLTLAYRVNYQGTVAGSTPFYVQQNQTTLYLSRIRTDILGGEVSIRGVNYCRIVGDGVVWGNAELRFRFFNFSLLKQDWYFVVNPFFDAGLAVQKFRSEDMKQTGDELIYSGDRESLHMSAGLGLKIVMNNSFVAGVEYGKPFDKRDGKGGIYLNINYIF